MPQIIVAILLYLGVISAPNTYTVSQLRAYESQYSTAIIAVQGDAQTMVTVHDDYVPMTDQIIIIDDTQW